MITSDEIAEQVRADLVSDVGEWHFNEQEGDTAIDDSPLGHHLTLTLHSGASWGEGVNQSASGLHLDGRTGSAETAEKVLNTDQSFSIEVQARLAETGAERTVVVQRNQVGVNPFAVKYDGAKWMVEMSSSPLEPTTWWRVRSTGDVVPGRWTMLKVNYDAAAQTLELWVDGVLQGTATGVKGWNSDGVLSVGRGRGGDHWSGDVDDLFVYQGLRPAESRTTQAPEGGSLSGDAKAEIISVDADGQVRAFLNENGEYPGLPQTIGAGWAGARTRFADLDADGRSEIIALDADGGIRAFHNTNGMNGFPFGAAHTIGRMTSTDPSRTQFADVDGDGRADRVSVDEDGRVRVYRNLFGLDLKGQSSTFATAPVVVKATFLSQDRIRFADIDGDRRAELITINEDGTVFGYRNRNGLGYGTFEDYQEIGYGWTPDRTWFANIDGDRRDEIITVRPDGTVWSFNNRYPLPGFPFDFPKQIGSGWHEPARVFFS